MAYSEALADRIRNFVRDLQPVEELRMMGGLCFMLHDKMLVGVIGDELMLRIDPALMADLIERPGCRQMTMGGRSMNGYVLVDETAHANPRAFGEWLQLAIDFNPRAKSSRKPKR